MVTLFVITTLAAVGLPMLNGFVGEFLILSGSMQILIAHHLLWTALAPPASFWRGLHAQDDSTRLLRTLGSGPKKSPAGTSTRASISSSGRWWLFLVMGVCLAIWMRAIDPTARR